MIIRNMPHQKLHILFILLDEVLPWETGVFPSIDLIRLAVEDKLHELFLIINGDFKDLELDGLAIVDAFTDELEVYYGFVAIEILVFILYLEDEFVY